MVRRESSEEVRTRLVEASVAQLAEAGMRGLTHRKVEQRAGVSQGLAKYHFGSLDGLIQAVLTHMVELQLGGVLQVTPEERAELVATGLPPVSLWIRARQVSDEMLARPDLQRARFELYLHAAGNPELQQIIGDARDQFVKRVAAELDVPNPEAGARLVIALIDGVLIDQLSAPEPVVEQMLPAYLLASAAAAAYVPAASFLNPIPADDVSSTNDPSSTGDPAPAREPAVSGEPTSAIGARETSVQGPGHRLAEVLGSHGDWTVAAAETISGGGIGAALASIPGASRYFAGSVTAYDYRAMVEVLDVPPEVLEAHGAVSAEAAAALARGAAGRFHATFAVAATGVAGPTGGTPQKPVGTVFLAVAGPEGVRTRECHFPGDRVSVMAATVDAAIRFFLAEITGGD